MNKIYKFKNKLIAKLDSFLFKHKTVSDQIHTNLSLIDIEPVLGCNLRCRMCHVSFMKKPVKYLDVERINFEFCRNKTVTIGAVFEPLIHPKINLLIEKLNAVNARLILITNAHNLNKKEIPALFKSTIDMVTFSFDGITKESYEEIRRGGNFNRTIDNIKKFVDVHKSKSAKFAVNFTVMQRNLSEVVDAPLFWNKIGIDLLRFIGMVVREKDDYLLKNNLWDVKELYSEKLLEARDRVQRRGLAIGVSNPKYREVMPKECPDGIYMNAGTLEASKFMSCHHKYEFDLESPIGNGCSSPLTTARIDWNGDVFLCHNQKIGNLLEKDFKDIWNLAEANALRSQLIDNNKICETCDYFNLCINSHYLDTTSIENFFSHDFKVRFPKEWELILAQRTTA